MSIEEPRELFECPCRPTSKTEGCVLAPSNEFVGEDRGRLVAMKPVLIISSRLLAVVVGGYAATVGVVAVVVVLLALIGGMQRSESITLMTMVGLLAYTGVIVWGFSEPRLRLLWSLLVGTAAISHGLAIGLAPLIPADVRGS